MNATRCVAGSFPVDMGDAHGRVAIGGLEATANMTRTLRRCFAGSFRLDMNDT